MASFALWQKNRLCWASIKVLRVTATVVDCHSWQISSRSFRPISIYLIFYEKELY